MKKILVTGGTGFIGAALVKKLAREGNAVRVFDNNSRGTPASLADVKNKIELVEGDIRDASRVTEAARGMDSLIHLAYINGTEFFYSKPDLVLDVAVRGMLSVMDACKANNIQDFVLASSSEVYQTPPVLPTPETVPLIVPDVMNPRYSYGGGKIICELLALHHMKTFCKRVLIFRPHNVYGPQMGWEHVLPQFILRALDLMDKTPSGPLSFPIQGEGAQTRAFIHIDDFVDGVMCLLKKGEHLNVYHIGNPEEVTIAEVARRVVKALGRDINLVPGKEPAGGTGRRCPDISKMAALGFSPKISFAQGLPGIVSWYKDNRHLQPLKAGMKA